MSFDLADERSPVRYLKRRPIRIPIISYEKYRYRYSYIDIVDAFGRSALVGVSQLTCKLLRLTQAINNILELSYT